MAAAEALLTAEEYALLPDDGQPTELVRGEVVPVPIPTPRHGQICATLVWSLMDFLEGLDLGCVVCNRAGVVTERDPDTVRGPDVSFYSYARVPRGPLPEGYLPVSPELVFEVLSPTDRWRHILVKVAEFLEAGVVAVCVLDQESQTARVYSAEQSDRLFTVEDDLVIPEVLPGFQVRVERLFS